jgi:hypothetical protein
VLPNVPAQSAAAASSAVSRFVMIPPGCVVARVSLERVKGIEPSS